MTSTQHTALDDSMLDGVAGGRGSDRSHGYFYPQFVFQTNDSDISNNVFQNNGAVTITVTQTNSNDRF